MNYGYDLYLAGGNEKDGLLSDLRRQKSESGGLFDYTKRTSKSLYNSTPASVCSGFFNFLFGFALPVAEIVIGMLNQSP